MADHDPRDMRHQLADISKQAEPDLRRNSISPERYFSKEMDG